MLTSLSLPQTSEGKACAALDRREETLRLQTRGEDPCGLLGGEACPQCAEDVGGKGSRCAGLQRPVGRTHAHQGP